MRYPIHEIIGELKDTLIEQSTVIVQAPPGAGKSTIIPAELLNEPWLKGKKIIMLEPRRLAARSIAHRIAELMGEQPGGTVGYRVRFETRVSDRTIIEIVTEAILIRMLQNDNSIAEVGLIIFDEFHERSLNADLSLALSLQVQRLLREDLRLLIMSATLDVDKLTSLLAGAPVIRSEGRSFPVTINYIESRNQDSLVDRTVRTVKKVLQAHIGDVLVFLPGYAEISRVEELLHDLDSGVRVHSLYANLPFEKQKAAIEKSVEGKRKIVLATTIAETSLTIEGVTVVIDGGKVRIPQFDPRSGLTRLELSNISVDSADQRAGRAGRLGPGVCYRLWSKSEHSLLQPFRRPEMLEADLAPMVLELLRWGVSDSKELDWITLPPEGAFKQALELLESLEAHRGGRITTRGKEMCALPTHPRLAHMLLSCTNDQEQKLACDIAALLEERDPSPWLGADFSSRVEVLRAFRRGDKVQGDKSILSRIEQLSASWRSFFKLPADNESVPDFLVGKLLATAYPERVAKQESRHSARYKLANGRVAMVNSNDAVIQYEWIVALMLDVRTHQGKIFQAAPIDVNDLRMTYVTDAVRWDDQEQRVTGRKETRYFNLVVSSIGLKKIEEDQKNDVLCKFIRDNGLRVLNFTESADQWRCRVMSLRKWRNEEIWPDVTDKALLNSLEEWLLPFAVAKLRLEEIQRIDLLNALATLLPWELHSKLEQYAPERIPVPSGSAIRLTYYQDGRPPELSVRLQELFGLTQTPVVNQGHNKVLLHLLSPGYKPMQVTQDLSSFWKTTYFEIRKELRVRYPRHAWPEDPLTAAPTRGVQRK